MLPASGDLLKGDFEIVEQPSKTFALHKDKEIIYGHTDGLEAVKQAVYCVLGIERYENLIYSWNYGIELKKLFGKPIPYVKSELKKRIKEALLQDDRVKNVSGFKFSVEGRKVHVTFEVESTAGVFTAEKEVDV